MTSFRGYTWRARKCEPSMLERELCLKRGPRTDLIWSASQGMKYFDFYVLNGKRKFDRGTGSKEPTREEFGLPF